MKKSNSKPTRDPSEVPTLIGTNSSFEGNFKGSDSLCIEGQFQGRLETEGTVFINQRARVKAEVYAQQVYVHGEIIGNIYAQEHLNVGASGRVTGEVTTRSLTVATGGFLNGSCQMEMGEVSAQKDAGRLGGLLETSASGGEAGPSRAEATAGGSQGQVDVLRDIIQQDETDEEEGAPEKK